MKRMAIVLTCLAMSSMGRQASAATPYFQGFEDGGWTQGVPDWTDFSGSVTRVATGVSGTISPTVPSSDGVGHALVTGTGAAFTQSDGYNYGAGSVGGIPFGNGYTTKLDIYLDPASHALANTPNDTRFDYSQAINKISDGTHLQDNIFAIGFYNSSDVTGPGAGSDRFIISESHNGTGNPKGGLSSTPFAITTTGWYTFEHKFYDDGGGAVAVDMSISDAATDALLKSWTLNPGNPVATTSGNRYGWLLNLALDELFIDNSSLELNPPPEASVPEPSTLSLAGIICVAAFAARRRRRRA